MPTVKTAAAWLREEDWPRWQTIDTEVWTYAEWLAKANEAIVLLEQRGVLIEKVVVEPDAFFAWCKRKRVSIEPKRRAEFAAAELRRRTLRRQRLFRP